MKRTIIQNATIVNEGRLFVGHLLIENDIIRKVSDRSINNVNAKMVDATGKVIIPGVIDDQVHFREPGLTHKAEIATESNAAVAGGVTSFMEMPNTNPQTTHFDALNRKYEIAEQVSPANYSFYFGATNDNLELIKKVDPKKVCGVKVFMGSSTGNMLVDDEKVLQGIFAESPVLIATHCEDETTIQKNLNAAKAKFGDDIPFNYHPIIRCHTACFLSSSKAVQLATKYNARLHVLHLSTAKETSLFSAGRPEDKKVTAEVCVHHLWFDKSQYDTKGSRIKWNPSIKDVADRDGLRHALLNGKIDVVATDHAPHTIAEKDNSYLAAPSGGPLVQHSLLAMLDLMHQGVFSIEQVVEKMCHNPAKLFQIEKRGFIREGYKADLVMIDLENPWKVKPSNILYKCGWSPFEEHTFQSSVDKTWVNGTLVYEDGQVLNAKPGEALSFNR